MKIRIALTSFATLALVVCTGLELSAASAPHGNVRLRAALRGLNEVPPTASLATATLQAVLDKSTSTITFSLAYQNLTANPTAAHLHFGPTKVNGGVITFLCGGGSKPACPEATSGTITGTITPADIIGPVAQGIAPGGFAAVVRAIETGNSYTNMHDANFRDGEIRGQIFATDGGRPDDEDADD